MNLTRWSEVSLSFVIFGLAGVAGAQTPQAAAEPATGDVIVTGPATPAVNPQIVRLKYVEGDVRVSPGSRAGHDGVAEWVQGATNLPLETGFSVVTGNGRAEIEFEDASTMYLAPDSVLTFNELTTKRGIPETEMALLTGTATLHVMPAMPGEVYSLRTPSDSLRVLFGSRADLRVDSYLDAMTLTPQKMMAITLNDGQAQESPLGMSVTYSHGRVVATAKPVLGAVSEWDRWVAGRVAAQEVETASVMKEAGLGATLPGLADLNAKGHFFPCEPYGTCWEPTNGWSARATPVAAPAGAQVQQAVAVQNGTKPKGKANQAGMLTIGGGGAAPAVLDFEEDFDFPCSPFAVRYWMERNLMTGEESLLDSSVDASLYPYNWAVCHAGSWINRNGRYAWVVGTRRHHHCPVRWVKTNGKVGYVPIHPRDVVGKEPLNLKHGVFEPMDRKRGTVRLASYEPGKRVETLTETPKQFRTAPMPVLSAAKAPSVEARAWIDTRPGAKVSIAERPVQTIAFDKRAQGFTLVTRTATGGKFSTSSSPMGGRVGMSQGSGSSFRGGSGGGSSNAGGHGYSAASSGGGFHGSSGGSASSGASPGGSSAGASSGAAHK